MTTRWRQIHCHDQSACERFVAIMHEMDRRYQAFNVQQFQSWINPADGGCYAGQRVDAFGWFRRDEDTAHWERMQCVVLGRYEPNTPNGDALMIGWAPSDPSITPDVLDAMVDQILEVGAEWLRSLDSTGNLKTVTAIRPRSMGSRNAKLLHDQIYWRAGVEPLPSPPARYLHLELERDLGEATYWRLALLR